MTNRESSHLQDLLLQKVDLRLQSGKARYLTVGHFFQHTFILTLQTANALADDCILVCSLKFSCFYFTVLSSTNLLLLLIIIIMLLSFSKFFEFTTLVQSSRLYPHLAPLPQHLPTTMFRLAELVRRGGISLSKLQHFSSCINCAKKREAHSISPVLLSSQAIPLFDAEWHVWVFIC